MFVGTAALILEFVYPSERERERGGVGCREGNSMLSALTLFRCGEHVHRISLFRFVGFEKQSLGGGGRGRRRGLFQKPPPPHALEPHRPTTQLAGLDLPCSSSTTSVCQTILCDVCLGNDRSGEGWGWGADGHGLGHGFLYPTDSKLAKWTVGRGSLTLARQSMSSTFLGVGEEMR